MRAVRCRRIDGFFRALTVEEISTFDHLAQQLQIVAAEGLRITHLQLDPIVMPGVVTRRDLQTAIELAVADREVIHRTGRWAHAKNMTPCGHQAFHCGIFEFRTVDARIASHDDARMQDAIALSQDGTKCLPDSTAGSSIELLVGFTANVVGTEDAWV